MVSDGTIRASAEGETTYLEGNDFEACTTADEVRRVATDALTKLFAAVSLLESGTRKPTIEGVAELLPDGTVRKFQSPRVTHMVVHE